MTQLRCIFCPAILNETTKPEHIIPNAIGGRKSSTVIVCSSCNHELGRQVDEPLADGFRIVRNQLNVPTGSGQPPPTLRNLDTNAGMMDLLPGGIPRRTSSSVTLDEGGRSFAIKSSNTSRYYELLFHQLYRCGYKPGDDIRRLKIVANHERLYVDGNESLVLSLGDPEHLRSIGKMAFEVFALQWRNEVHDPRLDEVRNFVRHGITSNCVMWDYENQPKLPFLLDELGPAYHSISVWSLAERTPLVAAVTLFGGYCWTVELAAEWWGDPFAFAHAVNPLTEKILGDHQAVGAVSCPRLAPGWASKRLPSPQAVQAHTIALFTTWHKRQREQHLRNMANRVVDNVFQREGWKDGDPWNDQMAGLLSEPIAREYMRFRSRTDLVESIDSEEIYQRIETEYPVFFASKQGKSSKHS